ncbi:MAG: tRNA pseudouridine(55) synthase TruB [Acidobacteria bacterium]|nr:tRNA pseudouridine(55) synthase TruB [Acidobacteriota bacterium]
MSEEIERMCGVVVLDKAAGWTSHDAVNKMRRIAGTKKVGHLGTLDPLATGVLPLVIGRATRLAQFYVKDRKAYRTTVKFGYATDTYDREGEAVGPEVAIELELGTVEGLLGEFRGKFKQMPPAISAKKIQGVPAYKLARQNKPVELSEVEVEIFKLEIERLEGNELDLYLECSAGTYVRSLAHDLGQRLGCGAHVDQLRRTLSGEFSIEDAFTLEQLEGFSREGKFAEAMLRGTRLLPEIPVETVDLLTESQIRQGRDFRTSPFRVSQAARLVKAMNQQGELIAIGEQRLPNVYHPILVI